MSLIPQTIIQAAPSDLSVLSVSRKLIRVSYITPLPVKSFHHSRTYNLPFAKTVEEIINIVEYIAIQGRRNTYMKTEIFPIPLTELSPSISALQCSTNRQTCHRGPRDTGLAAVVSCASNFSGLPQCCSVIRLHWMVLSRLARCRPSRPPCSSTHSNSFSLAFYSGMQHQCQDARPTV